MKQHEYLDGSPDLKLNLGCGYDYREGWLNVDLHEWHPADLFCDVTWLHSIQDGHAGHVLAQDILEHIERARVPTALREWNRVLRDGGTIEIRVPDILAIARRMQTDHDSIEGHEAMIHCLYGTQGYSGDYHLAGFTHRTLPVHMERAGFRIDDLRHKDEWLFECFATKVRDEYPDPVLRASSDDEFLRAVYRRTVGVEIDEAGYAQFMKSLTTGTSREAIMASIEWAHNNSRA